MAMADGKFSPDEDGDGDDVPTTITEMARVVEANKLRTDQHYEELKKIFARRMEAVEGQMMMMGMMARPMPSMGGGDDSGRDEVATEKERVQIEQVNDGASNPAAAVATKTKTGSNSGHKTVVANWFNAIMAKIIAGSIIVALLVSVFLGQRQRPIGRLSPSLLRRRITRQFPDAKIDAVVDSRHMSNEEDENKEEKEIDVAIDLQLAAVVDSHHAPDEGQSGDERQEGVLQVQRIAQEGLTPPTINGSILSYYPVWKNGGFCDNDPSQRPSNTAALGYTLFDSAAECCTYWYAYLEDNECLENSLSLSAQANSVPEHVDVETETGIPTPTPIFPGSPSPLTLSSPISIDSDSPTALKLSDYSDRPSEVSSTSITTSTMASGVPGRADNDDHASVKTDSDSPLTPHPVINPSTDIHQQGPHHYVDDAHGGLTQSLTTPPTNNDNKENGDDSIHNGNGDDAPESHGGGVEDYSADGDYEHARDCVADPEKCGCPHLKQADYRGAISVTQDGNHCERWDVVIDELEITSQHLGSEGNFCRKIESRDERAGCFVTVDAGVYEWQYCSVPDCWHSTPTSAGNEQMLLEGFYRSTGGEHWFNKTGWFDDEDYCHWFGVTCNAGFVTGINLRENNLTGTNPFYYLAFPELVRLDIAKNKLSGPLYNGVLLARKLEHVDISDNEFKGCADMTFSPATLYADYSRNKFTSVSFKRSSAAVYDKLQVVDLSDNLIDQDLARVFLNLPPNLEELDLSKNFIQGAFPNPFPRLENMRRFAIANNNINGSLPDFARATPRVRQLDLSNQKQTNDGGLSGSIPSEFSRLDELLVLNLDGNKLTSIPSDLGNLKRLKILNVSSNNLNQQIPPELGKLADAIEILDLSNNSLNGNIPSVFANFEDASVHLSGNIDLLLHHAPLMLCYRPKFDLVNNTVMCPPERTALYVFYESANGQEWANNHLWLDNDANICDWFGVTCSGSKNVIELNLTNNGLSGTLNEKISELAHLEILDLSDNDMKGSIPAAIEKLSKLTHIRLSYNGFIGSITAQLGNLTDLELIQLHRNRISGTIPTLNWAQNKDRSSFVADCGHPSDFDNTLKCSNCTMCCNNQGDCYPQVNSILEKVQADNFIHLTAMCSGFFFGAVGAVVMLLSLINKFREEYSRRRLSAKEKNDRYKDSLQIIGQDSVYQFVLGDKWWGWLVALVTIMVQVWMLREFVKGADVDISDNESDLVYTWKCARDRVECEFTGDVTPEGWAVFSALMVLHLLKDVLHGFRLIRLCTQEGNKKRIGFRFFFSGALLSFVTLYTLFASTVYNYAIATSNAEIIMNSVAIIFITDVDERLYDVLLLVIPQGVVEDMKHELARSEKREMQELCERFNLLQQQMTRAGLDTQPQDEGRFVDSDGLGGVSLREEQSGLSQHKHARPGIAIKPPAVGEDVQPYGSRRSNSASEEQRRRATR